MTTSGGAQASLRSPDRTSRKSPLQPRRLPWLAVPWFGGGANGVAAAAAAPAAAGCRPPPPQHGQASPAPPLPAQAVPLAQAGACLAGGAAGGAGLGLRPAPNGTLPRPLKREVKALGPPLSGGKRPRGDGGPPFVWADQGAGPHPAGVRLVRPARLQEALCAGAQWSVPALCWSW